MRIRSGTTTTRGEAHARANDARDGAAVDPGAAPARAGPESVAQPDPTVRDPSQAEFLERRHRPRAFIIARRVPRQLKLGGVHHRLEHGEEGKHVRVALGHEGDPTTQISGKGRDVVHANRPGDRANPRPRVGSSGYDVEQGTLSRARGTHHRENLTAVARARHSPEEDPSAPQ